MEAQILAASRTVTPINVPVRAVAVGGSTGVTGISRQIESQQTLAGAQAISIQRTGQLTSAEKLEAAAAKEAAREHEQFGRGIGANILQMLGLRGATLAASSAFIGGAAATIIAAKAIGAASDRTEQLNKSVEVFVGSADSVKQWASTTATALGISETAALSASSTFGELFRTLGIGPAQAAHLSESLVKLASDLASFNNVGTDRALNALQSGLVGQARPLRQLGIFLTEARVKQEAFAETGKKSATELTQQDKILARYALIMQDASIASGDFQRTQGRLANQGRILQAQLDDLAANIGSVLIPVLTEAIRETNNLLTAFARAETGAVKLFDKIKAGAKDAADAIPAPSSGGGLLSRIVGPVESALGPIKTLGADILLASNPALTFAIRAKTLIDVLATFGNSTKDAGNQLVGFARDSGDAADAQERLAGSVDHANRSLTQQSQVLADQLQKAQAAGASPATQLAIAQQKLATDIAAQREAEANQGKTGGITAVRKARAQVISDRNEIKSLQGEISSASAQAASAAQKAATDAKNARDKEDQALLSIFSAQQTKITDALITAGPKRAIALTIKLRDLYRKQRDEARKQIKDLQTRKETLAADTTEIITLNKQIHDLQKQQADALAQQIQDAQDAKQTHLEALLSIAETTTGTRDDVKALNAIIAFDRKRIDALKRKKKLTQEEKAELDALRVDMAQRNEALRNLIGEQKKNNTATAEFAFLQTQTGFVSNLLGNLIPGGSTAGLVGGSRPTTPDNVRQVSGGFEEARTHAQASGIRGPSQGQAETTNSLLRRILAELHRANQGSDHPEAHHQRRVGSAVMDFQSATPGF